MSDVDLEALVDGISTSLGVLKALAARSRKQKYLYEVQSAFCKDLTVRHKAREADLEEEVKNLKTALQASELNVAVARAEKDALAKVVSDAGVRAVTDYKAGSDYKEELEQYGARCYSVGLNAGRDFGEHLSWVERAREAFEAAVRECRRRTNDARLDDVTHMGARTCCSVISRVVPRCRIKVPVRKPPVNELGHALLRVAGAWVPFPPIRTEAWGRARRPRQKGRR
ncbi:hypothetical protein Taro_039850 [Colocasia esculenta]|uniref:Uncharacterized protein n=1 Tax=Colocasia esculenta TaxID=4460 RepID=A0A843WHL4_COLES|nr:hypothetical protein [Colocasia esculenta]